jgi:hypothetical protein
MFINNEKRNYNLRELSAFQRPDYFTCIDWKPLGRKIRYEAPDYKEALRKAKELIGKDNKVKVLIYVVRGSNYAFVNSQKLMKEQRIIYAK